MRAAEKEMAQTTIDGLQRWAIKQGYASYNSAAEEQQRKTTPRKGHKKSRLGCLNCKRRRVKCQETLPGCDNCERLGLPCEYAHGILPNASPTAAVSLQSTGNQFTMEDLRFFQHFLFHAYPPLPIKGHAVWQEVAAMSHHYDFLVHAMLGLAASHLSSKCPETYAPQALTHRVEAISSLNKALSTPCSSKAEGDARFATIMTLAFQSSHMVDGMLEFIAMIRGCIVVSGNSIPCYDESVFRSFAFDAHKQSVTSLTKASPLDTMWDRALVSAEGSLAALAPLCSSFLEAQYVTLMKGIMQKARVSQVDAMITIAEAYTRLGEASDEDFQSFIDTSNFVAQILLVHFFAIEHIISLLALEPVIERFLFRRPIIVAWILNVVQKTPSSLQPYLQWPKGMILLINSN